MPKHISYYAEKYAGYAYASLATGMAWRFIDFNNFEINDLSSK